MGLSTTYANIVLFVLVISVIYALMAEYSDQVSDTGFEVASQSERLKNRLATSIKLSSVTTDAADVILYAVNDGESTLDANCTDYFIDRQWIEQADINERRIMNASFDPGLWNPGETLRVRIAYDTDDGQPHEAKIVACNGGWDSTIFYHMG